MPAALCSVLGHDPGWCHLEHRRTQPTYLLCTQLGQSTHLGCVASLGTAGKVLGGAISQLDQQLQGSC